MRKNARPSGEMGASKSLQGNPPSGVELPVLHTIAFCLAAITAMNKTAKGRIGYANFSRVSAYFDGNSLIKNTTKDAR